MLTRIKKEKDIGAVVVHKIDRLARNMEDHVAIKAILKRHGASLVSVVENIEDTASGRLVEGIHALMAEFYSANLSMETKKGMLQKVKQGGWPLVAPIGYKNTSELINGRLVSRIEQDEERAPYIKEAFKLYATGQYSLYQLREILTEMGLKTRATKKWSSRPVSKANLALVLQNKLYIGIIEWGGVEYKGAHEPLIEKALFDKVQQVIRANDLAGERRRKHNHFLKGTIFCGACGSKLSVDTAKGHTYFYCLGKKRRNNCPQKYVAVEVVEEAIEHLYEKIQLAPEWADKMRTKFEQELIEGQQLKIDEQKLVARRMNRLVDERQKLMQAYYANAIPLSLLKQEQDRISTELEQAEKQMSSVNASEEYLRQWIDKALQMCSCCGLAYKKGNEQAKRLFNQAIFEKIYIKNGRISRVDYSAVFNRLFKPGVFLRSGSNKNYLAPRIGLSSNFWSKCAYMPQHNHQRLLCL